MTRVALIACDHGLGHVRRCVLVAEALRDAGADVTLLAPAGAVARVRDRLGVSGSDVTVEDFRTRTTPAALRAGDPDATRWEERLPDLAGYDRVVADTLPEILAVRPDAILLAQFVWHEVLEGVDPQYRDRASMLLETGATVIGSEPFTFPTLRAHPGYVGVGLYVTADVGPVAAVGPGALLVTGGTTPALREPLRRLVSGIASAGPGWFSEVLVDEGLAGEDPPQWMRPASHDRRMYDDIVAAVVRPGLGVLSELAARGIPAWCLREPGNRELVHNADVVVRAGLGHDLGAAPSSPDAYDRLVTRLLTRESVEGTGLRSAASTMRTDGASSAARAIVG